MLTGPYVALRFDVLEAVIGAARRGTHLHPEASWQALASTRERGPALQRLHPTTSATNGNVAGRECRGAAQATLRGQTASGCMLTGGPFSGIVVVMPYAPGSIGRCPHCNVSQRFEHLMVYQGVHGHARWTESSLASAGKKALAPDSASERIKLFGVSCAHCQRATLFAVVDGETLMLWPRAPSAKAPSEVATENPDLAQLFREAVEVLPVSPRASAALARRCLDEVLTDKLGAPFGNLESKIAHAKDRLPKAVGDALGRVREIGNYALHRRKSEASGEVVAVEPGEAEWTLQVVLRLFEHCYVLPRREQEWQARMDAKLADAKRDS